MYNCQNPRSWSYSRIIHKMSVIKSDGLCDILLKWVSLYWAGRPPFVWGVCWMGHISPSGCPCWDVCVCRTSLFSALHDLSLHVFNYINTFKWHSFTNIIHTYVRVSNPGEGETSRNRPTRPRGPPSLSSLFAGVKTAGAWL